MWVEEPENKQTGLGGCQLTGLQNRSESREGYSDALEKAGFLIISTTMLQKGIYNGIKMGSNEG